MSTERANNAIRRGAAWYASLPLEQRTATRAVPELKARFDLTAKQAIEALRLAQELREGRHGG